MKTLAAVAFSLVAESSLAQTTVSVAQLPCTPMHASVARESLTVVDSCGTVAHVGLAAFALQGLAQLPVSKALAVDVQGDHSLVLTDNRTVVREIVGGRKTTLFSTNFPTTIGQLVYWNDSIVVSYLYAPHLLDVRRRDGSLDRPLIPNAAYAPSRQKVLTFFADLIPLADEFLVFDRFDFRLFRISSSWAVRTIQKDQHPDYLRFAGERWYRELVAEPRSNGTQPPSSLELGGTYEAISSCSCGGVLYVLMVERDGSGGREIAYSGIDAVKWTGSVKVGGAPHRIACDDRWLYVLDWKAKTVKREPRPLG